MNKKPSWPWQTRYGGELGRRPSQRTAHTKRFRFTNQEKRDVVELIDEGWHPLDVAVAYGMSVIVVNDTGRVRGCRSVVYNNYNKWAPTYSKDVVVIREAMLQHAR